MACSSQRIDSAAGIIGHLTCAIMPAAKKKLKKEAQKRPKKAKKGQKRSSKMNNCYDAIHSAL
jgi:hypothetical protein